jgi:hypothetical protein
MRKIAITKTGNSTIVNVKENGVDINETFVYNKPTNLILRDNVVRVESQEHPILHFTFEELEDKLTTSNIISWITAASANYFFSNKF